MIYMIAAEKEDSSKGTKRPIRRVAYYAAWLPGWTTAEKATRYRDKREAEKDMKTCGSPKSERGWKKKVESFPI